MAGRRRALALLAALGVGVAVLVASGAGTAPEDPDDDALASRLADGERDPEPAPVREEPAVRPPEPLASAGFEASARVARRLARARAEWAAAQAFLAEGRAKDLVALARRLAEENPGFFDDPERAAELARAEGAVRAEGARVRLAALAKEIRLGGGDRARLEAQIAESLGVVARAGDGKEADELTRHLRRFLLPGGAPTGSDAKDWADATLAAFADDRRTRRAKDPKPPVVDADAAEQRRVDQLERLRQRGAVGLLDAIHAGLAWLALHQRDDGSFSDAATVERCGALGHAPACAEAATGAGDAFAIANTALVAIAFLDFRDQDVLGWFDPYLGRALDFVKRKQRADGSFPGAGQTYTTSIATMALAQAAGSSGSEELKAAATRGIGYLASIVGPLGGWRYGRNDPGDLSATAWAAQAIEAARNAGIEIPVVLTSCLDTFMRYFWLGEHRFTYQNRGAERASLFPAGMLVGRLAWKDLDPAAVASWTKYLRGLPAAKRPDLYTLYYGVRVSILLSQELVDPWKTWVFDLSKRQVTSGSKAGSFPTDLWRWPGGVTVQTAVAVLAMEHSLYLR